MSGSPAFLQNLTSQRSAGTLFNTFTAAKSVINVTDVVPIPGIYNAPANKFRIHVAGATSNIATTAGTIVFQIMMGSVAVWSSGLLVFTTTANTLVPFVLDVTMRLDSEGNGTAAKFLGIGTLTSINMQAAGSTAAANPTTGCINLVLPGTSPAVGTGFDSTAQQNLDFFVGFSNSQAGNGVQIYDYDPNQYRFGA